MWYNSKKSQHTEKKNCLLSLRMETSRSTKFSSMCCTKLMYRAVTLFNFLADLLSAHLLSPRDSPNSLPSSITDLKQFSEKSTRISISCISGICTRSVLCIGVNHSLASAWTPHWSSVDPVLLSHIFLSGHQIAWSDQSTGQSERGKKKDD